MRASQLTGPSPERELWASVLLQAIEDALFDRPSRKITGNAAPSVHEREEARRFLFDKRGAWARARERICFMAGVEPEAFTERIARKGGAIGESP